MTEYERTFLKDIKQYVKAYVILVQEGYKKEAHSYALCFYASFVGFLHSIYSPDRMVTTMTLKSLSIDIEMIHDLNRYIYSGDTQGKDNGSVSYCYNQATKIPYQNIDKILNCLFKLHSKIVANSYENIDEKKKIEETKELMFAIKPSLKKQRS